jgi:nitrate reductase NapE
MSDNDAAGNDVLVAPKAGAQRRREEFRTWLFLSLIMAPILSVLIVSGYGFVVWMYQLFVGPPGS